MNIKYAPVYDVPQISDKKWNALATQSIIDYYVKQTGQRPDKMNAFDWYYGKDEECSA